MHGGLYGGFPLCHRLSGFYEDLNMVAIIGISDQPCWLAEACKNCSSCLTGRRRGCQLSPIHFDMYVDGLEKDLVAAVDAAAPKLSYEAAATVCNCQKMCF